LIRKNSQLRWLFFLLYRLVFDWCHTGAKTGRVVSEFFQMFDVQVSIFLYHLHARPAT